MGLVQLENFPMVAAVAEGRNISGPERVLAAAGVVAMTGGSAFAGAAR